MRGRSACEKETPLKADPTAQQKLLDVQALDARLDTLAHQLRSLPEIAIEEEALAEHRRLFDRERDLQIAVSDLTAEQKRADRDVEQVKTRRARDTSRMEQGLITDPKALASMGHELESLERRITTLEDEELDVMERLEETQAHLSDVQRDMDAVKDRAGSASTARQEKAGVLEAEVATATADRAAAVADVPADLLALYEKLRAAKGGTGAAALRRGECGGCRLSLNAADLREIAAAPVDEVVRCEECQRILVRTSDSGL